MYYELCHHHFFCRKINNPFLHIRIPIITRRHNLSHVTFIQSFDKWLIIYLLSPKPHPLNKLATIDSTIIILAFFLNFILTPLFNQNKLSSFHFGRGKLIQYYFSFISNSCACCCFLFFNYFSTNSFRHILNLGAN